MENTIVIDTSVFVSALISSEGASREILRQCLSGCHKPLMGAALYWEYESLIGRKEVFKGCILNEKEREALLNAFMAVCCWVPVYYLWRPNLQDEADNHILELAVAGNAQAIVTHNIRDFKRGELLFLNVVILQPKQFLEKLQLRGREPCLH
jgi:uncharacterized protein